TGPRRPNRRPEFRPAESAEGHQKMPPGPSLATGPRRRARRPAPWQAKLEIAPGATPAVAAHSIPSAPLRGSGVRAWRQGRDPLATRLAAEQAVARRPPLR